MRKLLRILFCLIIGFHSISAFSQGGEEDNPPPSDPPTPIEAGTTLGGSTPVYEKGILGKLVNPLYLPLIGDTYFYGSVPFTAISYFPYLKKYGDNVSADFTETLDENEIYPLPIPGATPYTVAFSLAFLGHPSGLAGI